MFSDFFIQRPIFASVTGIVILLLGLVVLPFLPVNQYPDIAPPKVTVTTVYVGANAETVESAVTTPLEQSINGVEGMRYIQSTSTNDGQSQITVTFDHGRNENEAVMDVKNRVDIALGRLPAEVKATGVTVQKNTDAIIMGVAFYTPDGRYDQKFMSNYVDRNVVDALKRVSGVGQVLMFGERKYAMRLWLDPMKLAARQLSVSDVTQALATQNVSAPAGQVGLQPLNHPQSYQLPILVDGRLADEQEFLHLVLKRNADGSVIRLQDVGRAELGSEDYARSIRWRRHESVGFRVDQLPEANALEVSRAVTQELDRLAKNFPPGMKYAVGFNPTTFIDESIHEVQKTLFEAIFFVVLVILLFLQSWRTTLIPTITIPISLVGTFFFMKLFGFSINTLTMFGLILATGIVVDDAIVVIENIARKLEEDPNIPLAQAASEGMKEVFGAVVATALVLIAVFVPVSFFPGTTGLMYQQFALTIAFSVAISAINAVTLTPALAALILGRKREGADRNWVDRGFHAVDRVIQWFNQGYRRLLHGVVRVRYLALLIFAVLLVATAILFNVLPKGFIPSEDQGYFIIAAQGPQGASFDYMTGVLKKIENIMMKEPAVNGVFAVNGFGFSGSASNTALCFVPLKPIGERHDHESSMFSIINRNRGALMAISEAIVVPFEPPPVRGIGSLGGFQFELQDRRTQSDLNTLASSQFQLLGAMSQNPALTGGFATFTTDSPLLKVKVDREKAVSLDIPTDEIFRTLQVMMGSVYVNDFTYQNRSYRVYAQADAQFRDNPAALRQFYVRNRDDVMIPVSNVIEVQRTNGAPIISHFNLFRSTEINGSPAPGSSSGQAMQAMQDLSAKLPKGMGYEWSGLYLEQMEAGGQTALFLGLGLVFVFLVLAAQYESFLDPLIIILSVPLAMLGALLAIQLRGLDNNIFTQIGMVLLVGLASKNAILIVEFANQLRHHQGLSIIQAALQSAVIRFRPIVMTSMAFIIGVVPLVFAQGAGAAARQALGTAVFGGMIVSTLLSLFIVPVIYITLKSWAAWINTRFGRTQKY